MARAVEPAPPTIQRRFVVAALVCLIPALLPRELLTGPLSALAPGPAERLEYGAWLWPRQWAILALLLAGSAFLRPDAAAERQRLEPATRRVLLGLTLVALVLRLPGLNLGLWFDELWMLVEFVRADFGKSLRFFPADNHHPLYTLFAWLSVHGLGEANWTLRLPALLCGVASVPALFLFARPLVGARSALFAAALLAVSYHHVSFSQNARGYSALLLLTLLSSHGFLGTLRTGRLGPWVLHWTTLGLATFAHTTAVFLALAQLLVWLVARDGLRGAGGARRRYLPFSGLIHAASFSFALHALMFPQMLWFFIGRGDTEALAAEWKSPLWTALAAARSLGLGTALGLVLLVGGAAVALLGFARLWRRDATAALLSVLPALVGGAVTMALGRNLWPRFFFFCAGFAALLAALGIEGVLTPLAARLRRDAAGAARLVTGLEVALLLALCALLPRVWFVPKQDYAGARDWVLAEAGANDAVLTVGLASFPYADYYGGGFTPVDTVEAYERAAAGKEDVWVLSTFEIYLASRHPELYALLADRTTEVARFRGSIGDGDVIVLRQDR